MRVHAAAVQLVLEEVLLSDVHMHPYELLGWEGVFGTLFMAVALPVLHVLPGTAGAEQMPRQNLCRHQSHRSLCLAHASRDACKQQQDLADLVIASCSCDSA